MSHFVRVSLAFATLTFLLLLGAGSANANTLGSVFVTGHDPDFHSQLGPNTAGAQNIIDLGLNFVRNGNTAPILFLETSPAPNNALGDHTDSEGAWWLVATPPAILPVTTL